MKTKLEMAHEWAMKHGNAETVGSRQNMVKYAWEYADAMQAEAEKRKKEGVEEESKKSKEVRQKLINTFEKHKLHCSEEWQPDWSQAPSGYDWLVVGSRSGKGFFCPIEPSIVKDHYWFVGEVCLSVNKHDYQGDWRESLRKRPK